MGDRFSNTAILIVERWWTIGFRVPYFQANSWHTGGLINPIYVGHVWLNDPFVGPSFLFSESLWMMTQLPELSLPRWWRTRWHPWKMSMEVERYDPRTHWTSEMRGKLEMTWARWPDCSKMFKVDFIIFRHITKISSYFVLYFIPFFCLEISMGLRSECDDLCPKGLATSMETRPGQSQ